MSRIRHRDRLWDFVAEDSRGLARVREFTNEDELFADESSGRGDGGFECCLPLKELGARKDREHRWAKRRIDAGMVEFAGRALWDCLPQELTSSLLAQLGDENSPVRLKISGNSSIINDLPWEWLSPAEAGPLALRNDVRLCRSVPVLMRAPAMTVDMPIRILVLVTNPKDDRLLRADEEIDAVTGGLPSDRFAVHVISEPTRAGFAAQVSSVRPHIVHYIGHAGISHGDGHLILHTSDGRTSWVSPTAVSGHLPGSVRLVCLSTCYTTENYQLLGLLRLALSDVQLELPTMIANQYPVSQPSVNKFWSTFYSSLIECGGDASEAVHRARVATHELPESEGDWGSFAHVLRDRTGHVFRFDRTRGVSQEAVELKAHFATQLANELAEQLRNLGTQGSDSLETQVRAEAKRAYGFLEELGDSDL
jgi:hypothetical protein